ncbi:MAG: hypothetical protein IT449_10330 [Phycisphaerales bacterium]|nr:hypothetical protein [Phycisphaerales bacterium]
MTGNTYGGAAISQWAGDDDYVAQADINLNSGALAHLIVRYLDPDNWMAAEIRSNGSVKLVKCLDGRETNVASNTYTTAATVTVRIKASGSTYTIWVDGTQKISTTDGDLPWGTVALSGRSPKFSNIKVGYDNNADGDLDDAGDDLAISETFAGTAYTLNSDHSDGTNDAWCRAGNLVDDGQMRYTYDAWNRLVKVTRKQDTDIVIQTAEYDGLGRRVSKVVTKSGDLDGTYVYYYADTQAGGSMGGASPGGWSIVEIRDGSANVLQQVYHGTQYIDEIVAMRLEKGYAVVYQDANWNTLATCDLAGRVLERVFTTPYGSPIIEPETFFGDYDGDGDVDSTDDGFLGSGQTCWGSSPTSACRVFDFNCDGTLNASDETTMTALVAAASTNKRHENRTVSSIGMAFLHQGLIWDPPCHRYYNRLRCLGDLLERFDQRDPLGLQQSLNAYIRVRTNCISGLDPFGNRQCDSPYDHCCTAGEQEFTTELIGAKDAATCRLMARAARRAEKTTGLPNPGGTGQSNAFLHCYWACITALRMDPEHARKCVNAHEACNAGPDDQDAQDLHNDRLGISFATPGATDATCYSSCYNAVVAAGSANCPPPPIPANQAQTCSGGKPGTGNTPNYGIDCCDDCVF